MKDFTISKLDSLFFLMSTKSKRQKFESLNEYQSCKILYKFNPSILEIFFLLSYFDIWNLFISANDVQNLYKISYAQLY
ncbi:hypothetical protein BpHYR1_026167 [Brachionus plicatilis]|uniref:Uncharacterized protein n=1 Tax=Brachionus plicatilis TaxID=10195 RepID=A0A3M7T7T9_BRAPC|nr:hypothetical protein BpHYR1_026167 [Brachionus plicatilis]